MDRLGGFLGFRDREEELEEDYAVEEDAGVAPPPSPVRQDERRMQVRAYNHWASLLGNLNFPHVSDLEPEKLDDFGPYSVLLNVSEDIDNPKVVFVGAELASEAEHDCTLAQLSSVPSRSVLSRITDHYLQILANQAPIGFEAEFTNRQGINVLYRGILLPYSSNNETVDFIYGVINWKEMADQETADELLLAIDQALGSVGEEEGDFNDMVETAETLTKRPEARSGQDVFELGGGTMMDNHSKGALPQPYFGNPDDEAGTVSASQTPQRLDALGNPIGGHVVSGGTGREYDDYFDSAIKTAADYGLPEWGDEEEVGEDVDSVVDPLADDETSSSLISLVSRSSRTKKSVDLSNSEPSPAIPQAYHGEGVSLSTRMPKPYPGTGDYTEATPPVEEVLEDQGYNVDPVDDAQGYDAADRPLHESDEPAGLLDCLAAAREMAEAAQNTEDRSRKALYSAVGRAYDFSLEAKKAPGDFDELLVINGLTMQERAPMTPIVKLVFGAEYDKTRLTEYAAVLTHAHRLGVERGTLATFLREAEGGLKGVVQAERKARKEEQGKQADDKNAVRPALAKKLRGLEALSLADLEENGAEFALVMIRRTSEGALEIIGEVPEEVSLVERAARKLLG